MLDPEYLDEAGDLVAACYSGIEAEMLAYLSGLLAEHGPERLGQRGETALELLAQTRAPELRAIIESHSGDVSRAVESAVLDALDRSDRADAARIGKRAAAAIAGLPREAAATVEGIAAILERDNVDMVQGSLALWNRTVAAATAEVATGYADAQTAIHRAVRKMAREGIATVTYRDSETGRQTVTNRIDVAVRRHVRTQIAQDGMRRTERICEAADVELVEVSSHSPARPDHAAWQGRIFSLHGDVTVEGVRYRDLREATGYGTVTGLGGANCRHFFGPWLPGTPRMYEPDPPHPSGLPNDEVYALSQRQRARERSIRATKRELACAQSAGEKAAEVAGGQWSMRDIAEVERLKAKLRGQQKAMRDFIEDANSKGKAPVLRRAPVREWAGDMPRIRKGGAANRTVDEFLASPKGRRMMADSSASKTAARKALSEELREHGIRPASFRSLPGNEQDALAAMAGIALQSTRGDIEEARARSGKVTTAEAKAVGGSRKLRVWLGEKRRASLAVCVEEAMLSGDRTRMNAATIFARSVATRAMFKRREKRRQDDKGKLLVPEFSPDEKAVIIPLRNDIADKVAVHEVLHLEDHLGTVVHGEGGKFTTGPHRFSSSVFSSKGKGILHSLERDLESLEKAARDAGIGTEAYVLMCATTAGLNTSYESISFLSDFLNAATRGKQSLGYGHFGYDINGKKYWDTVGNVCAECLANYGGSAVGNPVEYEVIKELFPETATTLDELLEAMSDDNERAE